MKYEVAGAPVTNYDSHGGSGEQFARRRVNNDDYYIMTDDPNFHPNVYGIEATEMKVLQ